MFSLKVQDVRADTYCMTQNSTLRIATAFAEIVAHDEGIVFDPYDAVSAELDVDYAHYQGGDDWACDIEQEIVLRVRTKKSGHEVKFTYFDEITHLMTWIAGVIPGKPRRWMKDEEYLCIVKGFGGNEMKLRGVPKGPLWNMHVEGNGTPYNSVLGIGRHRFDA